MSETVATEIRQRASASPGIVRLWEWARQMQSPWTIADAAAACGLSLNRCFRMIRGLGNAGFFTEVERKRRGPHQGTIPARWRFADEATKLSAPPPMIEARGAFRVVSEPEWVEAARMKGKRRPLSPARRRFASELQRGVSKGGRGAKGVDNFHALPYALCDPDGYVHRGVNIVQFVRDNPHLFDLEDVDWKLDSCRAARCLAKLRPTILKPRYEWKGWTWQQ